MLIHVAKYFPATLSDVMESPIKETIISTKKRNLSVSQKRKILQLLITRYQD